MRTLLSGLCALAFVLGVAAGCTDTSSDRVGESPGDRTPAASPPTAPPPDTAGGGAGSDTLKGAPGSPPAREQSPPGR